MIRKAIFMMALCMCGQLHANAETMNDGTDDFVSSGINEDMLRQIEPTYLKEVTVPSAWSSNWFVSMSGGISTFVGKPHGTGNLFDRMKPSLAIKAGKWFTPEIGGRFSFQGFQFKDASKNVRDYKMVHADFLWNVTSSFVKEHATTQRWGFIPYVGCGIIHNEDNGKSPFVINYGVIGQYRLTKRLAVNMANLDELARVAKAYHLKISVVGAADSATGNDGINNPLSKSRADYITQQLVVRGIDKSMIISKSEGGIDKYSPVAANRHTAVRLFAR